MTTITTTQPVPTTQALLGTGATVGVVAATLATLFAHGWTEAVVVAAAIAVTVAGVYGYLAPRAVAGHRTGGTALALSLIAALLLLPAFWSGLPLVLGVAGMIVGNAGRRARTGAGMSIAGLVIGALTVLGYLAIYVSEGLAGKTGFLFS